MIMSTLAFEITSSFLFSSMIYCNSNIKSIRTCSKEQEDVEINSFGTLVLSFGTLLLLINEYLESLERVYFLPNVSPNILRNFDL